MKIFVVSDSENGYIFDFGKKVFILNSLLKSTELVTVLSKSVIVKTPNNPTSGLHVYTD